jgi:hypothetical protein
VLQSHLACAAYELPLYPPEDARFFGAAMGRALSALQSQRLLGAHPKSPTAGGLCFTGLSASPAADVSLRTIDPERRAAAPGVRRTCAAWGVPAVAAVGRARQRLRLAANWPRPPPRPLPRPLCAGT